MRNSWKIKKKPGVTVLGFLQHYNIGYNSFNAFVYRYAFKTHTHPELQAQIKRAYEDYLVKLKENPGLNYSSYHKKFNSKVKAANLSDFKIHLKYKEIVGRYEKNPPCSREEVIKKYYLVEPKNLSRIESKRSLKKKEIPPNAEPDNLSFFQMGKNNEEPAQQVILGPDLNAIQPQDDLEIIIKKGIRILISPAIDELPILNLIKTIRNL